MHNTCLEYHLMLYYFEYISNYITLYNFSNIYVQKKNHKALHFLRTKLEILYTVIE